MLSQSVTKKKKKNPFFNYFFSFIQKITLTYLLPIDVKIIESAFVHI